MGTGPVRKPKFVTIKTVDGMHGVQTQPRKPTSPIEPGHMKPGVGGC